MATIPNTPEAAVALVVALMQNLVNSGNLTREDFGLIIAAANATAGPGASDASNGDKPKGYSFDGWL